jgi:hypothetical protein
MTDDELNHLLLRRFPSLLDGYFALKRLWGGAEPGPHVVYGDLLVPLIQTALAASHREDVDAAAGLLEGLSSSGEETVLDLVVTSVLEPLVGDPRRSSLEGALGPRTLRLWNRLIAEYG